MATIYQKTASDRTNILAPRECYFRAFDFDNWTEMRMGIYYDGVSSSGDNLVNVNETVAATTNADRIAFGIKNSSTNDIPGFAGSLFLGAISGIGGSAISEGTGSPLRFRGAAVGGALSGVGFNGVTAINGTTSDTLGVDMRFPNASLSTSYNGFFALKFVISNRGLSTQSIAISGVSTETISGTDYAAGALRSQINNATYGTAVNIAWNNGSTAYDIPDAVWIRMPFYSNRIRMSVASPMLVRYAP